MLLARFHGDTPVHVPTGINLQVLLIRPNIHLDARHMTRQSKYSQIRRLGRRIPRPIEDEGVIVASAVEAAPVGVRDVLPDLFGGGEVKRSALDDFKAAGGDKDVVDLDSPRGIGHIKGVLEDGGGLLVDKGTEIPVDVIREHDGSGLV